MFVHESDDPNKHDKPKHKKVCTPEVSKNLRKADSQGQINVDQTGQHIVVDGGYTHLDRRLT